MTYENLFNCVTKNDFAAELAEEIEAYEVSDAVKEQAQGTDVKNLTRLYTNADMNVREARLRYLECKAQYEATEDEETRTKLAEKMQKYVDRLVRYAAEANAYKEARVAAKATLKEQAATEAADAAEATEAVAEVVAE